MRPGKRKRRRASVAGRDKYDIGRARETGGGGLCGGTGALSGYNKVVQDAWDLRCAGMGPQEPLLPESAWEEWTWRSGPAQACSIECLLNRSHLLGLLLARYRGAMQGRFHGSPLTLLDHLGGGSAAASLCLFAHRPVAEYTLRELRDSVQNMQVQWVESGAVLVPAIMEGVDSCFHRLGVLASVAADVSTPPYGAPRPAPRLASVAADGDVMNDQGSIEDAGGNLFRMNRICLRRFLNVFLVLYRHIQLHDTAIVLDGPVADCGLKSHHIVASGDDFSTVSMHWDLMPAARLNYMHDFPGMYNCVSQVVYFHNPRYESRLQERLDVQSVSLGTAEAVHTIPCLLQIHPEIGVLYEDDDADGTAQGYSWLVAGKRVYLLSPGGAVHYHENVVGLLWHYRGVTGR